jgi:type 2A phosphatase activator TIP41
VRRFYPKAAGSWEAAGPEVIDKAMLMSRELPILFYDDVTLFEDELHDHGVVQLSAKIRVMPT